MNTAFDYPVETARRRAERLAESIRPGLDTTMRREVSALAGHSDWPGAVDRPAISAFEQGLSGLLRRLIENADEHDRSRPAVAVVETLEAEPRQFLRRRGERGFVSLFPGFWRPDGTWRDSDLGPGGEELAEYIKSTLEAPGGERLSLELTMQNIDGGDLAAPRTYRRSDLLAAGGEVELPIDAVAAEAIEERVRALRQHAAEQLQASGWLGPPKDLWAGLRLQVVIERVEGATDYASDRQRATPILEELAQAVRETERNLT
jgi:hypothetical protein